MAVLSPSPKAQFLDASGNPLVGGKVYTYAAGTTTPLATFTTGAGTVANTNPVILDSRGEANIWYSNGTSYKVVLADSANATIWTVDNIVTIGSMAFQNANAVAITGGTIGSGVTFNGNTTGTASNVTGVVAVVNGGTGSTTAANARTALGAAKSGANDDITALDQDVVLVATGDDWRDQHRLPRRTAERPNVSLPTGADRQRQAHLDHHRRRHDPGQQRGSVPDWRDGRYLQQQRQQPEHRHHD
jgi:hypothetical protein